MNERIFGIQITSYLTIWMLIFVGVSGFILISETDQVIAAGPTEVSGIISTNTIWSVGNSPYIVTGNLLVNEGINLTIEPGITVKFDKAVYLKTDGTLYAVGTESNKIIFTANNATPTSGYWKELKFGDKSKDSILKYCLLTFGNKGIECLDSSINIINCQITNSSSKIECLSSSVQIMNSNITDRLYLKDGDFTIINNTFSENGGIELENSRSNISILKNNFIDNYRAIILKNCPGHIIDNYIANNQYGLFCYENNIQIKRNVIINNNIGINYTPGTIDPYTDTPRITKNNITGNKIGFLIFQSVNTSIKNNNIYQNTEYNVYNKDATNVNFQYNWWGTTNKNSINQSIYDYYTDFELGKVIFEPFLSSPVDITLINQVPLANAGPDQNATVNQTVNFDGSGSSDPDGDPLTYKWSFGDGNSTSWLTSNKTSHNYTNSGNYNVTLTVSDGELTDTDTCDINVTIVVKNQAPIADAGPDQNTTVNQTVNFDGSGSSDSDGDPLTYKWSFGDGSSTVWQNSSNTSHSYSKPGNYTIYLNVSDGKLTDLDSCIVRVTSGGTTSKTEMSGIISTDTTLTLANSPYIVTGNILVEKGVNLTIEPGVKVMFNKAMYMKIDGTLCAVGSESNTIIFSANSAKPHVGFWKEIRFSEKSKISILKYCNITYGTKGIECLSTSLNIINCQIAYVGNGIECSKSIINVMNSNIKIPLSLKDSDFSIINNTFIDASGLNVENSRSEISIKNNKFLDNYYAISIRKCPGNVIDNYFSGNNLGIYYSGDNIQIKRNLIVNNKLGINCTPGSANISNNIITDDNDIGIQLNLDPYGKSPQITNNNISGNKIGFSLFNPINATIKNNNIFQNTQYSVQNKDATNVNFQYNWWGTTNTNTINESIYDYYDDFELGKVIYKPFLTSPVNISTVIQTKNQPPVAKASSNKTVCIFGNPLTLSAEGSYDPDGDELNYKWYSNIDGKVGVQKVVKNIFFSLGDHTITLEVSDGIFTTNTTIKVFIVKSYRELNDTDGDNIPDHLDKFPQNPKEWNDTDGDGIGDNTDAFPIDPAASVDSDGDKYPDSWNSNKTAKDSTTGLELDQFPFDPTKYKVQTADDGSGNNNSWIIIVLVVCIIVLLLIILKLSMVVRKRKREPPEKPDIDHDLADKIFNEILYSNKREEIEISNSELESLLDKKYHNSEISGDTYEFIMNNIINQKKKKYIKEGNDNEDERLRKF